MEKMDQDTARNVALRRAAEENDAFAMVFMGCEGWGVITLSEALDAELDISYVALQNGEVRDFEEWSEQTYQSILQHLGNPPELRTSDLDLLHFRALKTGALKQFKEWLLAQDLQEQFRKTLMRCWPN